jgi:hypothetical protein
MADRIKKTPKLEDRIIFLGWYLGLPEGKRKAFLKKAEKITGKGIEKLIENLEKAAAGVEGEAIQKELERAIKRLEDQAEDGEIDVAEYEKKVDATIDRYTRAVEKLKKTIAKTRKAE